MQLLPFQIILELAATKLLACLGWAEASGPLASASQRAGSAGYRHAPLYIVYSGIVFEHYHLGVLHSLT